MLCDGKRVRFIPEALVGEAVTVVRTRGWPLRARFAAIPLHVSEPKCQECSCLHTLTRLVLRTRRSLALRDHCVIGELVLREARALIRSTPRPLLRGSGFALAPQDEAAGKLGLRPRTSSMSTRGRRRTPSHLKH